jgi:aspartyl-tRNA(Asn)/glutamyl-tRNA(Gln) amidotransferase subunit C
MILSTAVVRQIARLARLDLDPDEMETMARDLASILDHIRDLERVDTEGLPAMRGVSEHTAPMRQDRPKADPLHLSLAEIAPAFAEGFFVVPRLAALDADAMDGGGSA